MSEQGQNVAAAVVEFAPARRVNESMTAAMERRALRWMAERAPAWVSPDHLTLLGLLAQVGAGLCFALARYDRRALLLVVVCVVGNWLGDSMDGTLARVRNQQRPRFGFYVDHMVDVFGATALMGGMGLSGLVHAQVALAMLIAFLVLSCESYLASYTLSRFEMSQARFGPTEIRLLLIVGTLAVLRNAYATIFGRRLLLFDVGGVIATVLMAAMALVLTVRHTAELSRKERLR